MPPPRKRRRVVRRPEQPPGQAFAMRSDRTPELRPETRELASEAGPHATHSTRRLEHVTARQFSFLQPVEYTLVDERSQRLHQVNRQPAAIAHVGVHQPERGVEAERIRRDQRLSLEHGIAVSRHPRAERRSPTFSS